jgi:hypothetical protein
MISAEQYEADIRAKFGKEGQVAQQGQNKGDMFDLTKHQPGKPMPGASTVPQGTPVPEGTIISQVVGRGQQAPSMMVVPPKQPGGPPAAQIQMVPPSGSGRTTIGTFVEQPKEPVRIENTGGSNPLTAAPAPTQSGIEAPPAEPERPKRKPLDLAQVMLDHIFELGGEKAEAAQKFYDRSDQTLRNWCRNPATIPLEALIKCLNRRPGVKEDILAHLEPHFSANGEMTQSLPTRGKLSVMVCAPILERPTLPFCWAMLYLAKKYELGFQFMADTMIQRSRNKLAQRFLESGAQWSLWIDGDTAPPIANPDWFRWITGSAVISDDQTRYDVLERLLSHNKPVVGGVYASRRYHGALVMQPEINPRSHEDKLLCNDLRKGLSRGMQEVDWIGFGCALVHRAVFLELQGRFPELAPAAEFQPWRFFQPVADEGEDEAFCRRVKQCAIPIWLDTDLIAGHIGNMCFLPEHTQAVMAL